MAAMYELLFVCTYGLHLIEHSPDTVTSPTPGAADMGDHGG